MTAVEWLIEEISEKYNFRFATYYGQEIQQAKQMEKEQNNYSEENMQEYVEFCIECLNQGLPPIIAKDWFNLYKNK